MTIHIIYIGIIILLLLLLMMVWSAHHKNSTFLLSINCLVAEMFLDETRYYGLKSIFDAFILDEKQPINTDRIDKDNFDENRTYWISSAFQVEKATQNMMLSEVGNSYEELAHTLNIKFIEQKNSK